MAYYTVTKMQRLHEPVKARDHGFILILLGPGRNCLDARK